jgi:hypothetical protein
MFKKKIGKLLTKIKLLNNFKKNPFKKKKKKNFREYQTFNEVMCASHFRIMPLFRTKQCIYCVRINKETSIGLKPSAADKSSSI